MLACIDTLLAPAGARTQDPLAASLASMDPGPSGSAAPELQRLMLLLSNTKKEEEVARREAAVARKEAAVAEKAAAEAELALHSARGR